MSVTIYRCYTVNTPLYDYLTSITEGLSKADYKLFCHLLVSTLLHFRQTHESSKGWISISGKFIQAKFRTAVPKHLEAKGLIHIDNQYFPGKRSRHYKVADWVIDGYVAEASQGTTNQQQQKWVNLITGKPIPPVSINSPITTLPTAEIPKLIGQAIECFSICYYSREEVLIHLSMLQVQYQQDPTDSNRFRYLNDFICFDTTEKLSSPTPDNPNVYHFKPSYTVQSTGRISTALQSCSRAMKRAAYASIPNVFNYDLVSSQITLSLAEMKKHDIECPWLEDYLANKTKRSEYASYIGISEDTWKSCLCTVLMGGLLPTSTKWGEKTSIVKILREELGEDNTTVEGALSRLRVVLKPLLRPLKLWHKRVTEQVAMAGYIVNSVGLRREYNDFKKTNKTSGIVAHILQGTETYFIHTLTTLADKYGFKPLGNEHDGLITLGRIPSKAIEGAKELTGLYCLELREKPFIGL